MSAYQFQCPSCGNLDASKAQLRLPVWFHIVVDADEPCLEPGDSVGPDYEARGEVFCEECDHTSDERDFIVDVGEDKSEVAS